jgi:hypothetical protein
VRWPRLLAGTGLAYIDVDDTVRQTFGYAKQGAGRGYTSVKGLNALLAVVSTPSSAPLICAARLRKGSTNSAKGAHRLVADALVTARKAAPAGVRVLRADSAFYGYEVIAACRRHKSHLSITARQDPAVSTAIASIDPMPGRRSGTPTPCGTSTLRPGSATPTSPRFPTPRSPRDVRPNASPPG